MTPEGRVKAKVKKILQPYLEMGILWGDWPVPGGYGKSGLDYHGCIKGRYFAIETKPEKGKLTDRQRHTVGRIQLASGVVFVIIGDEGLRQLEGWLQTIATEG